MKVAAGLTLRKRVPQPQTLIQGWPSVVGAAQMKHRQPNLLYFLSPTNIVQLMDYERTSNPLPQHTPTL